ncbi:MAG: hypothetical protein MZW92_29925 [Comamonadaceae bacterium]|nr:hypothetical protein [Comamonadaceae bacterium]
MRPLRSRSGRSTSRRSEGEEKDHEEEHHARPPGPGHRSSSDSSFRPASRRRDYGYTTTYVGYGYGYSGYGGYYGAGLLLRGGYGAVVVRPPVGGYYGGARVGHY